MSFILFPIDELLNIGGQLYTQRLRINLGDNIQAVKGERVLGEPCTQIKIENYYGNAWISVRGNVDEVTQQMATVASGGQLDPNLIPLPRSAPKGEKGATAKGLDDDILEAIRKVDRVPSDAVPFTPVKA